MNIKTAIPVDRSEALTKLLPLIWVFKYKFDKEGYLNAFKAKIYIQGDLQPENDLEKTATTLAATTFQILAAIITTTDLETRQLNAINAFPNNRLDKKIWINYPED